MFHAIKLCISFHLIIFNPLVLCLSKDIVGFGWGGATLNLPSYDRNSDDSQIKPDCENYRQFQYNSFVCVCTESQPCDRLDGPIITPAGVVTKWVSSREGARFRKERLKLTKKKGFVNIDKVNPQLYIRVNRDVKYQTIFGFGGAFTDATGINFKSLGRRMENWMIRDCFGKEGLEYNIARIPIAGTDFSTRPYTYDDSFGDKELKNFSLAFEDFEYKIPIIKKANLMAKQEIKLIASPWSAPAWMKTNNNLTNCGNIKGEVGGKYWQIYAKYLNAYKANGINHWGVTVQNEPYGCQIWNSMFYTPEMTRDFVVKNLGPVLEYNGYGPDQLKLMILDHNVRYVQEWASKIFSDKEASRYVAGTAIHWYEFSPKSLLDEPHNQFPNKFIIATEASVEGGVRLGDWRTADLYAQDILDDLLHHVIGWIDWNMALDTQGGPNWVNNFVDSPLIVDQNRNEYYRQPHFYAMAHFSKFLASGSVRIDTSIVNRNNNNCLVGAFRTPYGSTVIIVVNTDKIEVDFIVDDVKAGRLVTKIGPKSIQTYVYFDDNPTSKPKRPEQYYVSRHVQDYPPIILKPSFW